MKCHCIFRKTKADSFEHSIFSFIKYFLQMKTLSSGKLGKIQNRHNPAPSQQTGFPSAATHYTEPSIDLHKELVLNRDATFFARIEGDELEEFDIQDGDVLIIDRSLSAVSNRLALTIVDGEFTVLRIPKKQVGSEFILWGIITYIIHYVQ